MNLDSVAPLHPLGVNLRQRVVRSMLLVNRRSTGNEQDVLSPVSTTRVDGPLTRAVNSGSGNRALGDVLR